MKRATVADRPAIEAFLKANAAYMMFPWSNLRRHGMDNDNPRAMSFWYAGDEEITDLLGVTTEGMIMPYCPNTAVDLHPLLSGRPIMGVLGESDCVARLRASVGLGPAPLDESEPHFDLPLDQMIMPDVQGFTLCPLERAPHEVLCEWRTAFGTETLAMSPEAAKAKAVSDIDRYIENQTHRVLLDAGLPVAMTGFNGNAPGVVQIGGVYTPPALRNRGYARKAVALHLQEAAQGGVTKAFLFAANDAAEKAYRAIGFQQIGRFTIAVYDDPQYV